MFLMNLLAPLLFGLFVAFIGNLIGFHPIQSFMAAVIFGWLIVRESTN